MDVHIGTAPPASGSGNEVVEDNLLSMLRSMNTDTQLLALNLLEALPVPKSAVTDLFAISQFARDRRLRFPAETLLGSAVPRRWLDGLLDEIRRPTFRPDEYPTWFRRIRGRSIIDSKLLARYLYSWGLLSLPAYIQIGVFHPESFFHSFMTGTTLHLERLHLHTVPREITSLRGVDTIDLSRNGLQEVGRVVSQLSGIRTLHLEDNRLTTFSSTLGGMSQLEALHAGRNQIKSLPAALSKLGQLRILSLEENELEQMPAFMTELLRLEQLNLRQNRLKALPRPIERWQSLAHLNVSRNQLAALPEHIGQLPRLRHLGLSRNQLTALPEAWAPGSVLESLHLSHNQLGELPDWVGHLPRLQHLDLRHNPLEALPRSISPATPLQSLRIGPLNDDLLLPFLDRLMQTHPRLRVAIVPQPTSDQADRLPQAFPHLDLTFLQP